MYKTILTISLFLLPMIIAKEWGLAESYRVACNPSETFYKKTEYRWFPTRYQAEFYVERNGAINEPYLLLYRENEGEPIYLHAKITAIERVNNSTQTSIKGLPDYFVQRLYKSEAHKTESAYI